MHVHLVSQQYSVQGCYYPICYQSPWHHSIEAKEVNTVTQSKSNLIQNLNYGTLRYWKKQFATFEVDISSEKSIFSEFGNHITNFVLGTLGRFPSHFSFATIGNKYQVLGCLHDRIGLLLPFSVFYSKNEYIYIYIYWGI